MKTISSANWRRKSNYKMGTARKKMPMLKVITTMVMTRLTKMQTTNLAKMTKTQINLKK